jgi:cyclopropane-fatty-acyl-phospholipid synthase
MSTAANKASSTVLDWTERGLVPDSVIRAGIRRLCRQRLKDIGAADIEVSAARLDDFVRRMGTAEIAPVPQLANEQHYEVPPEFFQTVLGRHAKYSCCYWNPDVESLEQAEHDALALTCERAGVEDGMTVLDLGCGWGSLSLWIAARYPNCSVTAVSNSAPQRRHIEALARKRGLGNLSVLTQDMNLFEAPGRYDRVLSVEMFEHMRNYGELFRRISTWLKPQGRFFMHIFCHRSSAYEYVDEGPADWMSRHFFSGGIMPADELPLHFQQHLKLVRKFRWNGRHYEKTANAWLANMDRQRDRIMPILENTYGVDDAEKWFQRWRIFFMACAELFGLERGREWYVSHYLFQPAGRERSDPDA